MGTFKDSLKKWFYTQNSSAASSDARVPLLDASGNPKGSDTMTNIASALGGAMNTFMMERFVGDVNTLIPEAFGRISFYMAWSGCTNLPTGVNAGYLIAFRWTHSYYAKQVLIVDSAIYHRNKTGENTWSEWYQL